MVTQCVKSTRESSALTKQMCVFSVLCVMCWIGTSCVDKETRHMIELD